MNSLKGGAFLVETKVYSKVVYMYSIKNKHMEEIYDGSDR